MQIIRYCLKNTYCESDIFLPFEFCSFEVLFPKREKVRGNQKYVFHTCRILYNFQTTQTKKKKVFQCIFKENFLRKLNKNKFIGH